MTFASETGGSSLTFSGLTSGGLSIFQPVVNPTNIVLNAVTSPANLVVQPFSVTANAVAGQNLTVTYQVDNESGNAVTSAWTDSVYLSTQPTLNANSVLLGRLQQTGVAANGQYTGTVTAPVPGLMQDNYYVIVLADSRGLVPEVNRTNTELASTNPVQITIPALTVGSPASGTIDNGQDVYYQINLSAGQDVAISAGLAALQGGELYVGYQTVPTTSTFEASSTSATQTTQQVVIPDTQAGTYYILLQGDTGSTGGKPFTVSAQTLPLQVTSVGPSQAGNSGTTTLTVQGAEFNAQTSVSLVPHGGGSAIAATQVTFQGSTTLFAQFDLSGKAAGVYDVVVTNGTQTATDPSAFTVTSNAAPGHISYNLSVPSISRPGRIAYLTLTYTNDGGSDALAPLFVVSVTSDNATIGLPGQTSFSGSSVQLLGIENTGPAGTLPPGYQGTLQIPYESTTLAQGAEINFGLQVLTGDSTPMNWSSLESSLQPSYIPNSAWPAVFANLTASFGSTTDSYLTVPRQRGHLPEPARRVHRRRPAPVRLRDQHGQRRPHERLDRLGHRRLVPRPRRDPARLRPPVQCLDLGPRHDGAIRPGLDRQLADQRQRRQPGERHDQRRRLLALLRQELRRQLHRRARRIRHPDARQRRVPVRPDRRHDHRLQPQRLARLRARHQRQPDHGRLQLQRRADQPDGLATARRSRSPTMPRA